MKVDGSTFAHFCLALSLSLVWMGHMRRIWISLHLHHCITTTKHLISSCIDIAPWLWHIIRRDPSFKSLRTKMAKGSTVYQHTLTAKLKIDMFSGLPYKTSSLTCIIKRGALRGWFSWQTRITKCISSVLKSLIPHDEMTYPTFATAIVVEYRESNTLQFRNGSYWDLHLKRTSISWAIPCSY